MEFISLAEELDLISVISKWSVTAAMDQVVGWRKSGYDRLVVAVNLSASELSDPELGKFLISELQARELPANVIELEITETSGIESNVVAARLLNELSEHGFTIAIDDFGTGFASMNYLQLFPIDRIKIDRSFVTNVDTNERNAELVRAMISLGSCLKINVLAEGVETQEELSFLQDYGCDEVQGYFLSKPLEAETVFQFAEDQQYVSQRILQSRMRLWGVSGLGNTLDRPSPDASQSDSQNSSTKSNLPINDIVAVVNPYPTATSVEGEDCLVLSDEDDTDLPRTGTNG